MPRLRGFLAADLAGWADGSRDATSGGDAAQELDESAEVVGEVGHPDAGVRPGQPDRANRQSHGLLLDREDVLDRRPVARAPGIATTDVRRQRASGRAAAVDVADEAVALQPGLVPLRAVGGIGPHAGPGVCRIEEAFAQEPAVVAAGVGIVPAADQPEPLVNAGVCLVAEGRDCDLRQPRTLGVGRLAAGLDRPPGIDLGRPRRLIRPDLLGHSSRP